MPTKSTGNSRNRTFSGQSNNATFVDLSLSSTEEASLKAAKITKTTWLGAYTEMLVGGYKVTLKIDKRNNSYMCMVQDADYNPDISPTIYVMRAGSAEGALLKMAWYWRVSDGTLPDPNAAPENELDDDDIFA